MIKIDELEKLLERGDYVELKPDGTVIVAERNSTKQMYELLRAKFEENLTELHNLRELLNTPETEDFDKAVPLEATHQVGRWSAEHDAGKQPEDWFWLVGYLAGKALAAHKTCLNTNEHYAVRDEAWMKARHHTISTAAALRNWHAHIRNGTTTMRPGIEEPK